jgi:septum formation protein
MKILMLVLASASPRRQDLLRSAGITFVVEPANVDETPRPGESAGDCCQRLAREKALAVWRRRPGDDVLGADTIVEVDGRILGKPEDRQDAARMLRMLSDRVHRVITGVCLVRAVSGPAQVAPPGPEALRTDPGKLENASETTLVTMCAISEQEIRDYVATGEPMDKAGAYAIQGRASRWIGRIEGDYSNVVGLPVALVYRMLGQAEG